ncbi:MAG: hypothetical protein WD200_03195 [Candidatus Andersenbacteria bacterium]
MTRIYLILSIVAAVLVGTWVSAYLSIVLAEDPKQLALAQYPLWPVACSTRGCVTTRSWQRMHMQANQFAIAHSAPKPTAASTLTTVVRRHLTAHAFLSSPITAADARRYREEILHLTHDEQIKDVVDMTISEYDQDVLVPFLQQEALRQQIKAESVEEVYKTLAAERFIVIPLFHYTWEKDEAVIKSR